MPSTPGKPTPSQEELHRLFYCVDGKFYRKVRTANRTYIGEQAGYVSPRGYTLLRVNSQNYRLHRLVWKYYYGVEPGNDLDHIDGDTTNNNVWNLNDGTQVDNRRNNIISRNRGYLIYDTTSGKNKLTEAGKIHHARYERERRRKRKEGNKG
mgnify:CR=1 FL=1